MKNFNSFIIRQHGTLIIFIISLMVFSLESAFAQDQTTYMRIAKITVDSTKINDYKIALKEQMQSALQLEKGVLAYSAVQDKKNPERITILETYANIEAYQAHIQTAHFKKYKAIVTDMVKQLELIDVDPIAIKSKVNSKK
jgi:quinol monooxygenase YgiN